VLETFGYSVLLQEYTTSLARRRKEINAKLKEKRKKFNICIVHDCKAA
jgi:hypothetical protein